MRVLILKFFDYNDAFLGSGLDKVVMNMIALML